MKRRLIIFLILFTMLTVTGYAMEEDVPELYSGDLSFEGWLEYEGKIVIEADGDYYDGASAYLDIYNLQIGEIYRLSISGTAADGEPFRYTHTLNAKYRHEDFYIEYISRTPGLHGPYQLEFVSDNCCLEYEVYFSVDSSVVEDKEEWASWDDWERFCDACFLDTGVVMQPSFWEFNPDRTAINFLFPAEGSYLYGSDGCAFECTIDIPSFPNELDAENMEDELELELEECSSNQIVYTAHVPLWQDGNGIDWPLHSLFSFSSIPVSAFTSGEEYELRARIVIGENEYAGSVRFTMMDEKQSEQEASLENAEACVEAYDAEIEDWKRIEFSLEEHTSGDPIVCDFENGQDVWIEIGGFEAEAYRVRLSGTALDGKPFVLEQYASPFYVDIGAQAGSYGPFTLELICGKETRSAELIFNFAQSVEAEEWDDPFIADEGVCDPFLFISYPGDPVFQSPAPGSVLTGVQGGALDIVMYHDFFLRRHGGFCFRTSKRSNRRND